ncbi:MAG: type II CAAX prenyl endopeptidase Rce1 family protein [Bryobacteraceae bacterium]
MKAPPQWIAAAEPFAVFALIMAYIWRLRAAAPFSWTGILALILISHACRGERARDLGFRWSNFGAAAAEAAPMLLWISLVLLGAGMLARSLRPIGFETGLLSFAAYCPWGLLQQYLLNGYFVNRLSAAWPRRRVPLVAAALFSGAHLPNWFLMLATFAGGYACARLYLKHRNLYFLGLAHAVTGFLLFLAAPDSISRHLNVGPGWFRQLP